MRNQKLYESVRKYIDKYYIDRPDDIKLDKEMKSIFDRISEFRKKKATKIRIEGFYEFQDSRHSVLFATNRIQLPFHTQEQCAMPTLAIPSAC